MLNKLLAGILLACASSVACADQKQFDMREIEASTSPGAHVAVVAPPAEDTRINEQDMSVETLERLFRSAFFKTSQEGENGLVVQVSADRSVRIHIDRQHNLLFFFKVFGFKGGAEQSRRIDLANRINNSVILVRASVPDDHTDSLVLDYYLSYQEAVLAYQVVNAARDFSDVAVKAVNQFDSDDIIE
ncbi:MAG: hypothetical protein PHH47_11110 [Gallionella sp.]|nr:hypothetical protein [Gallionella sp.]MDD4946989.1 hypothetical protein [Gallionella sp.]